MIEAMALKVHAFSGLLLPEEMPCNPSATDYGSVGWGFDSLRVHHLNQQLTTSKL